MPTACIRSGNKTASKSHQDSKTRRFTKRDEIIFYTQTAFSTFEIASREYWIIYPVEKDLTVFLLDPNGKYQTRTSLTRGDMARSAVLDGFEINLDEVFEDILKEPEEDYEEKVRRI